jgi:hypothetical protein
MCRSIAAGVAWGRDHDQHRHCDRILLECECSRIREEVPSPPRLSTPDSRGYDTHLTKCCDHQP